MAKKNKFKKWVLDNIFNLVTLIIFLLILGFVVFALSTGFYNGVSWSNVNNYFSNPEINETQFENPNPDNTICSYTFREDEICVGEEGVADLKYEPNSACRIGFKYTDPEGKVYDWKLYGNVILDENGEEILRDTPGFQGDYLFRMVCIDNNNQLCFDEDNIKVIWCGDDSDSDEIISDCTSNNDIEVGDCGLLTDEITCNNAYYTVMEYQYECIWEEKLQSAKCVIADEPC